MNLAWATVVLVVLLAPGFLFFSSLSIVDPVRRETGPGNPLAQLGGVVIAAFLIHAVCFLASSLLCSPERGLACVNLSALFATLRLETDGVNQVSRDAGAAIASIVQHPIALLSYWLVTCAIGWCLGIAADRFVLQRWPGMSYRGHYPWLYEIRAKMRDGYVEAYVVTDTIADGWVLMYRGFLDGFYAGPDGTVRQLALRYPRRFRMRVGDPARGGQATNEANIAMALGTSVPLALDDADEDLDGEEMDGVFLIGGDRIRNAYFRYFPAV